MEKIVSLCKRKGFIFPTSEIYGGLNGFFDYGPLGIEMKRCIKEAWWKSMVQYRDNVIGIDTAIIQHPKVWQSSGHIDGFSDPMVDCKTSKKRYRADQLFWGEVKVDNNIIGHISVLESSNMQETAQQSADKLKRKLQRSGELEVVKLHPYTEATEELYSKIPSPANGQCGSLTPPRAFNLMFQTHIGALQEESSVAYLRPETAQGIFTNFKNILDSGRMKIPFGVAQIGRSFRNEITPRNFIFRSREFEQMEMEFFIEPGDGWKTWHEYWINERMNWHKKIGIKSELLSLDVHPENKLAHYSRACTDIQFKYPFGVQELEGIAARGCFDLTQHAKGSGKSMEYFDTTTQTKFIPHVIEPALGLDRTFLALLCSAYEEDTINGESRTVLKLAPTIAPVKAAVFPLLKNKPELVKKAQAFYKKLQRHWNITYDASGAIGRRYRRVDEIGVPFAITVDFDSLDDNTLTLRDRDTAKQTRHSEEEIIKIIDEACTF